MNSAWEFVEQYYPGYSSSSDITENDDLHKIIDGEVEEGSHAEKLFKEEYAAAKLDYNNLDEHDLNIEALKRIQHRKDASDAYIFEKAIENYLKTTKDAIKKYILE